jgi:hypothetical protein
MLMGASVAGGVALLAGVVWLVALLHGLAGALWNRVAQVPASRRLLFAGVTSVVLGVGAPPIARLLILPVVAQLAGSGAARAGPRAVRAQPPSVVPRAAPVTPAGVAVVTFGLRRWVLPPGGSLTFGRGAESALRFGDDPADDLVSRSAGVLLGQGDGVLVRNASRKRAVLLQAVPGPELEIPPLMAVGTMPYAHTRLVVVGGHGARYVIGIDTSALRAAPAPAGRPRPALAPARAAGLPTTAGYERIPGLPAAERRYLAALCEPLLTKVGGPFGAPTYAAIAARCGVSPRTVRNVLDQLRARLTTELGIPGLVAADGAAAGRTSYLGALARWAVDSGNATHEDLEALDASREPGEPS